ncbi:uncharacterized protein NPIL_434851 [Nephila pilipes]|uniref:Uncharacterized protein n=1 Tax=Nephila pilipes TaxID=299642 RepID=A0A8X6QXR3_NEPPI|nr:uncharacterized protein NPIL_434851 [Nephila pilipes]
MSQVLILFNQVTKDENRQSERMKENLNGDGKLREGYETPLTERKEKDVFKSPTSSISAESGIDMMYYSFRSTGRNTGRRKPIIPVVEDETNHDTSTDSVFPESTGTKQEDKSSYLMALLTPESKYTLSPSTEDLTNLNVSDVPVSEVKQ